MATETLAVARWLYQMLTNDVALQTLVQGKVFAYRAPEGTAFPYVLFQLQSSDLDSRIGETRLASRGRWVVKAVGKGSDFLPLRSIASRLDEVISGGSGLTMDGVIVACVREQPLEMLESSDSGEDYGHLGGIYQITVVSA
jgi:hypothetical protein